MSEKKKPQKPKVTIGERLSEREIKQLMGVYDPTYKRVNGKIKRK